MLLQWIFCLVCFRRGGRCIVFSVGSCDEDSFVVVFLRFSDVFVSSVLVSDWRGCGRRWFSGRMLACHAGGPGSIPGRRTPLFTSHNTISNITITKTH